MISKFLKSLWQIVINSFCNSAEKLHCWAMKDPKDKIIFDGFNVILLGVNGLLLFELLIPASLGDIAKKPLIIGIVGIILSVSLWAVVGILKTLTTKEITISLKYKFLSLLLLIPLQLFMHKILIWFKLNYVRQNNGGN